VILDENRFDAIKKLEAFRQSSISNGTGSVPVEHPERTTKPTES
jgi:hypothetical protein